MNNNTRTYHSHYNTTTLLAEDNTYTKLAAYVLSRMPRTRKGKFNARKSNRGHN
jgi:hypothetical protein